MSNPGERFPLYPISWYLFGSCRELRRRPVTKNILGRRLVGFQTASGRVAVLDARCAHLGADLGEGCLKGESLQCPFHHWEYGVDGRCTRIPSQAHIPEFARQVSYPVEVRHGFVFIFNGSEPAFPLPTFANVQPDELIAAQPFANLIDCPWYMIAANAFDFQHFRASHDRTLVGKPTIDCSAAFARRATVLLDVDGTGIRDRLTRWFAGNRLEMATTCWGGNLMLVTASFRRTTSYGLVDLQPLAGDRTLVRIIVLVQRSAGTAGRMLFDPINLGLRRYFIRKFLETDVVRLSGVRYNPHTLLETDWGMAEYFEWLGRSARPEARAVPSANGSASVGQAL